MSYQTLHFFKLKGRYTVCPVPVVKCECACAGNPSHEKRVPCPRLKAVEVERARRQPVRAELWPVLGELLQDPAADRVEGSFSKE
jgi:hypothetical protein